MSVKSYLLSLPERLVRSTLGLGAGVVREAGELALPVAVRRSQLYQNLVETTLRYVIENVGGVEGVSRADQELPSDFLTRRAAGNAVEVLGIVAFRASPVWVLAALADLSGLGRHLIPQIADALKGEGLLEKEAQFTSVDEMLDGLERTSSRLATTINTPPLDVPGLRAEWQAIRQEARSLPAPSLPSRETISSLWTRLTDEATRQNRSVFETSSMMAVSAARGLPDGVRWLSASARVGAARTGQLLGAALLDHYRQTLDDIQQVGYAAYASRQLRPYVRAAIEQFSPQRRTLTDRLVEKLQSFEDRAMPIALPRPGTDEYDPASAAYVARAPALDDAARQLEVQRDEVVELFSIVADANADFRYAAGKWSIREVLGHLADTERILAYRLLRIGRGDASPLPGFDENTYVPAADFERRPIADVLDEWVAVRNATLALVRGMPPDAWTRRGVANNTPVTARALVYVIVGHVEHHREGLAHNYGVVI